MRKLILALDPGKTTGWALFNTEDQSFESGQDDFNTNASRVHKLAAEHTTDLDIVSESFTITVATAKNTQATWSLELIGVYRYMSNVYTAQDVVLQAPSAAKRLATDDRLNAMEWLKRPLHGNGHANDAARHLMLYLLSRGWMDDRIILSA